MPKKRRKQSPRQLDAARSPETTAAAQRNTPAAEKSNGGGTELYLSYEKRGLWPSQIIETAFKPYQLVPRNWKLEIPHLVAVFALVILLYGYTTPRLVTLEDDGLFIANLHFFGVAHPPGYPIHTFLGGLFYHLMPFGTPAFKGHLFSGFAGAIGCAAIYAIVAMLVRGRVFAYLAGLAYACSDTFWSQAIIAEVYTLNSMFFFIIMALCVHYAGHVGRSGHAHRKIFIAITFVYGLGVANHYPLLGLGSIGLGMIVLSQIGNILPRTVLGIGGILAGAVPPYMWMVWRSGYNIAENPANFYGPIGFLGLNEKEKVVDFSFYFFRSGYSGVDKQAGVGLEDKLIFGGELAHDMLWQFTPLGLALAVIGVLAMMRSRYNWLCLSLLASWFMSSVLLVYLLDFKAEYIWKAAFRVYHLLAFGIMAIWLAYGAAWVTDKAKLILPTIAWRQVGGLILVAVVGMTVYTHWEKNNRRDYSWAHDLAVAKLNSVEPNAVLFTFDDLDLPVGYLHFVEGLRPDLKVYNDQALVYGDRLYSPLLPDNPRGNNPDAPSKSKILRRFIEDQQRPIYYHAARQKLYSHPRFGSDSLGFFRRVNRTGPQERIILSDHLRVWLDQNAGKHSEITDLWTRQQHYSTVQQLVNAVQLASYNGLELSPEWEEIIQRALQQNALARLASNSHRLSFGRMSEELMQRELNWMKEFHPSEEPLLGRQLHASFYWQKGVFARQLGDDTIPFEETMKKGWEVHQTANNAAAFELLNLYQSEKRYCEFIGLVETMYPKTEDIPKENLPALRHARSQSGNCSTKTAQK